MLLDDEIRTAIIAAGKSTAMTEDATVDDARTLQRRMAAAFAGEPPQDVAVRDIVVSAPGGALTYRLYTPMAVGSGLVVFIHGGGWVGGDLQTHDSLCRTLAVGSRCAFLALTYRLAPEHRFPAPVEDCVFGARWALDHADRLGCSGAVAIMGESAGGNLAAVAQLVLASEGRQRFAFQCLAYPATDLRMPVAALTEPQDPLALTVEEALWCRAQYLGAKDEMHDWRASPILAPHLGASPPTHVLTAGIDPIRDDGIAFCDALRMAGVETFHEHEPSLPHGFLSLPRSIARVATAQDSVALLLRSRLA